MLIKKIELCGNTDTILHLERLNALSELIPIIMTTDYLRKFHEDAKEMMIGPQNSTKL